MRSVCLFIEIEVQCAVLILSYGHAQIFGNVICLHIGPVLEDLFFHFPAVDLLRVISV